MTFGRIAWGDIRRCPPGPRLSSQPTPETERFSITFFGHLFSLAIPAIPVTDSDQSRWLGSTDPPHPIDELVARNALDQGVGDPVDIYETRGFVE